MAVKISGTTVINNSRDPVKTIIIKSYVIGIRF